MLRILHLKYMHLLYEANMLLSNKSIIKAYICMFILGSSSCITENRTAKIHEIKGDDEKGGEKKLCK